MYIYIINIDIYIDICLPKFVPIIPSIQPSSQPFFSPNGSDAKEQDNSDRSRQGSSERVDMQIVGKFPVPKDPFVCPKDPGLTLESYCGDGIETINPILGRGLDA